MATPIIKWVGGKRQLLEEITARLPENFGTYFEPFFGGGAVFFSINPEHAVINDFNSQLVNVYKQIKDNCDFVAEKLNKMQDEYNNLGSDEEKTTYYSTLRATFNECIEHDSLTVDSASLFIFINKTCFNGLYRVNAKGKFNVPSAHKDTVKVYDASNLAEASERLKNAVIRQGDFEKACRGAKKGDLVFFDSPYYDTFDTYQAGGFSEADHIRLANLFKRLSKRGVYCVLTNSNTDFIKNLYEDYNIDVVSVKRLINRDAQNRTGEEVIITNF